MSLSSPTSSAYLTLAVAIVAEVIATTALKSSDGMTRVLPALVVAMAAMESGQPVVVGLVVALVFACLVGLPVSGLVLLNSRYEKRSGHGIG